MSSSECLSPTRCRPQHLDRERLRGVLSSLQYADVRYHEAVVFASSTQPKSFQLLALAADCVYLFPLTSHQALKPPICIQWKHVVAVDVVSPALSGQRGMMLESSSQLFHIIVREKIKIETKTKTRTKTKVLSPKSPKPGSSEKMVITAGVKEEEGEVRWEQIEYFVSTFEPNSRVFFCVSQAFQKAILQPPAALLHYQDSESEELGEMAELMDSLIDEFITQPEHDKKSALLNELAVAGTCNLGLQRVFFANRTQLRQSSSSGSSGVAPASAGLPAFLIQELFALLVENQDVRDLELSSLEYLASMLNLLTRMCFAGQLMSERLHFFLESSLEELILILTSTVHRGSKDNSQASHLQDDQTTKLVTEEILDNQVALLLELEALQHESNSIDPTYFSDSLGTRYLPQLLHRSPSFPQWVGKLFKRIARSVSRAESELRQINKRRGSSWSLALWRNVKLLDLSWNAPSVNTRVLSLVLESRVDYLK